LSNFNPMKIRLTCYNEVMKYLIIFIFLWILPITSSALYGINNPALVAGDKSTYETRLKESGKLAGSSEREVQKARYAGRDYFVVKTIGQAEINNGDKLTSLTTSYYQINSDGSINVYSHEGESKKNGQPFSYVKITFDWPSRVAGLLFENLDKKQTKTKTIELTDNTVYTSDLAPYLQACVQNKRQAGKLKLIIPTGDTYNMIFQIKSDSDNSFRVDLKPDLGLLSGIIPSITFWFQGEAPHHFIRYEGPQGGPFSPIVVEKKIK